MPPSLGHSHTEDTSAFLSLHWQLDHDLVPHRRGTLPAEADLVFAEQSLPLCCRRGTPPPPPWQPAGQPRPKPRSKPAIITIPSHCQHTDHPCYQPESGAGGFCHNQWVTDCDKVTLDQKLPPRSQLLCKREKAAALPPSWSLLHLDCKTAPFWGLLLLLPSPRAAGNCCCGALSRSRSFAAEAAAAAAELKPARQQQSSTGRWLPHRAG